MARPDSVLTARRASRAPGWEALLVVILIASLGVGRWLSPVFLTGANLENVLADLTEVALMALPMTLVIVAAEIDLSVASVLGASSALLGVLWHLGLPMPAAIALVLVAGALAGLFNGLVIVKLNLPSLAVTIGTLALFRGLAYVLLGDQAIADFPPAYTLFAMNTLGNTFIPQPFAIVVVAAFGFTLLLQATAFGRSLYAIGANSTAAAFSGIDVPRLKLRLFVISGAMSALAGVLYTLRFTSARGDNGEGFELSVIAAVLFGGVSIFGGRGSMVGVLLSLAIVGVLKNALTLADVSSETLTIVTGALLLASVLIPNMAARWRAVRDRRIVARSTT
ncbi:ABC transporter permease [Paraburkholderia caballeronis]|uniref:Autoinducer 2 import system permease protein LsrD n=1 Tax=Paraburkholderia caballeronis TaxID=416943 RepID=A0A1H7IW44_9BURK|nr:ABC transporter permease [Paraburkholderia caballeronis]PXW27683.1 monosaccharide ABC transporter membrane protein (CUT2 family) [Paraburkholderia caballeronis]PXX03157.1 monosaccharide ABC transporter membrane protein (CUT2 family) [Paraburkholderia caballeronis]RAK03882.1 monosaccharide ABC transporter membrane protein (CUT2 family) [Paraburkholderia caballeronis]TDV20938.1 monosaccharide ABC transporter membrane protein (CUT2 family) [Paraburkholderia caballeronis]TDV21367.1 monosacchari